MGQSVQIFFEKWKENVSQDSATFTVVIRPEFKLPAKIETTFSQILAIK